MAGPELAAEGIEPLARVVGFTPEQLVANREGEVTSEQLDPLTSGVVMPALLVVATVAGVIAFAVRARGPHPGGRIATLVLVALGALAFAVWLGLDPVRDRVERTPAVVEGPIDAVEGGGGPKGGQSVVKIGGLSLMAMGAHGQIQDELRPGSYRVYYLRHTERLLSMEPLVEAVVEAEPEAKSP